MCQVLRPEIRFTSGRMGFQIEILGAEIGFEEKGGRDTPLNSSGALLVLSAQAMPIIA